MKRLIMIAVGALFAMNSSAAKADTYDHFDQIAKTIERQANEFRSEVRHYRHTRQYPHLLRDALILSRTARHAHITAHIGCNLAHLEADIRELDGKLHHIQELLHEIEVAAAYGHGHVHGHTGHVHGLLQSMLDNVHHLTDDLHALRTPVHHSRVIVQRPGVHVLFGSSHYGHYAPFHHGGHDFGHGHGRGHGHDAHSVIKHRPRIRIGFGF